MKKQISELKIIPIKESTTRYVVLENDILLRVMGDGRGYDENNNEWTEVGNGFAEICGEEIDWSEMLGEDE